MDIVHNGREQDLDQAYNLSARPRFAPFRFPKQSYLEVESAFIRGEIQRGSFDDIEYREYVDKLVWIESLTRGNTTGMGAPVRVWWSAAKHPAEFDIIREELGASTRAALEPNAGVHRGADDGAVQERDHARQWRRVQEADV